MKTKICNKCNLELNINKFSIGTSKNGLYCWCKNCAKKHNQIYNKIHKDAVAKRKKLWAELNKEKIKKYMKIYRRIHKEELIKYNKIQYQISKEKRKIIKRNRQKIDIDFKILCYLRTRLWYALKRNIKSKSTMELVGCSIEQLKQHLASKFIKGMFWQNYGQWHVDHIRPCASFDLSNPEEQRKCFNWKNLQPLWAKENLSKSDKLSFIDKTN